MEEPRLRWRLAALPVTAEGKGSCEQGRWGSLAHGCGLYSVLASLLPFLSVLSDADQSSGVSVCRSLYPIEGRLGCFQFGAI